MNGAEDSRRDHTPPTGRRRPVSRRRRSADPKSDVPIPVLVLPEAVLKLIEAAVESDDPEVKNALVADALAEAMKDDGLLQQIAKMAREQAGRKGSGSD